MPELLVVWLIAAAGVVAGFAAARAIYRRGFADGLAEGRSRRFVAALGRGSWLQVVSAKEFGVGDPISVGGEPFVVVDKAENA